MTKGAFYLKILAKLGVKSNVISRKFGQSARKWWEQRLKQWSRKKKR